MFSACMYDQTRLVSTNGRGYSQLWCSALKATAVSKPLEANTIVLSLAASEKHIKDPKWMDYADYGANYCYGRG